MDEKVGKEKSWRLLAGFTAGIPVLDIAGASLSELQDALSFFSGPVILERNGGRRRPDIVMVGAGSIHHGIIARLGMREDAPLLLSVGTADLADTLSEAVQELRTAIENYPYNDFDAHLRASVPADTKKPVRKKGIRNKFKAGMEKLIRSRRAFQRRRV